MGSSPIRVARNASVAQLVEQRTENPRVVGSIPTGGTSGRISAAICGFSSFGRARPCQGRGGGFEPRNPLQNEKKTPIRVSFFHFGTDHGCKKRLPKAGGRLRSNRLFRATPVDRNGRAPVIRRDERGAFYLGRVAPLLVGDRGPPRTSVPTGLI